MDAAAEVEAAEGAAAASAAKIPGKAAYPLRGKGQDKSPEPTERQKDLSAKKQLIELQNRAAVAEKEEEINKMLSETVKKLQEESKQSQQHGRPARVPRKNQGIEGQTEDNECPMQQQRGSC